MIRNIFESKSFMESHLDILKKIMKDISKLFNKNNIRFVFIGGAARNQYNATKITEDIDILVSKEDKEKVLNLPIGYIRELSHGRGKVFQWHDPKTKVEIMYSGEISGDGINGLTYDEPDKLSVNKDDIPILSLEKLIEYKLSSGIYGDREKDFADVRLLIEKNNLQLNFADNFRSDLIDKYRELWNKEHSKKNIIDKQFEI